MDDVVRAGEDSAQSPAGWIATAGNADADPKDAQGQGDDPGQTERPTATASALGELRHLTAALCLEKTVSFSVAAMWKCGTLKSHSETGFCGPA